MADITGTIISHYRIDNLIGAGGMGTVYKAYDLNLSRPVALKLMHPHIARQAEFRERLKAEAKTAANLDHPSIVKIYNFGETDDGLLYVAMEFIKDGSLRKHMQRVQARRGYLDVPLILQIASQIADALDAAHNAGVIHRDVKPGNIILKRVPRSEEAGFAPFRAVLTDFGLVQIIDAERRTESGLAMGTPIYMSPEQCEDLPLDGRADLYSLGIVLYEMLAGRPPFEFTSLSQAIAAHIKNQFPIPVREVRSEVPPLLDALLSRALAKRPEDRFESGKEMSEALRMAYFSMSDAPTSWWSSQPANAVADIELSPPLTGEELIVRTMGRGEIDRYVLSKEQYTIGRSASNDLVLASGAVSRHHARLEHTTEGWIVQALVGINGTFLNKERLTPEKPVRLYPGDLFQIGPYEIWLRDQANPIREPTMVQEPSIGGRPTPIVESEPEAVTQILQRDELAEQAQEVFGLFLDPRIAAVEPGRSAEFVLEILNRSHLDDRVRLEISGIPQSWVNLSNGFTPLPAGERAEVRFIIQPPRSADASYGRQRFRIELESQNQPVFRPAVNGELNITTFEQFAVTIQPSELRLPEKVTVSLTNQGNQAAEYAVVARESEDRIKFTGERGRVPVQPGQTVDIELELESRNTAMLVAQIDIPWEVEVRSSTGAVQVRHGSALNGSTLLPLLRLIALTILVTICVLPILFGITNLIDSRSAAVALPIQVTAVPLASPTPLASLVLTPTVVISETVVSPDGSGDLEDRDGDGLSNRQESILGSLPDNPDSDNDGLTDGLEVLQYGTQPTIPDSDGDGLSDGDEVLRFFTLPNRRDSDGDGVDDATELANGSDPNSAETVATLIPTTGVAVPTTEAIATDLPPTAIVGVASATPIPATAAPIATLIPSLTPLPTAILPATAEPAPPTIELTAAPLPTKTFTPEPIPTLIATETTVPPVGVEATATNVPIDPTREIPTLAELNCAVTTPQIDGVMNLAEWGSEHIVVSLRAVDETPLAEISASKDSQNIYFAIDAVALNPQPVRIYIDVNNNLGDPDEADRYLRIGLAEDDQQIWVGSGTNSDGQLWDGPPIEPNLNWTVAVESYVDGVVIEIAIPLFAEFAQLAPDFSIMVESAVTAEELVRWPLSAEPDDAETWQAVRNSAECSQ